MLSNFPEMKIKKIAYPNLIYDQIIASIKNGTLKPGDSLPSESDLIEQFSVGRTSVREAIAGLEYMNVISAGNGKYYVNEDISSYFEKKIQFHYQIDAEKRRDAFVVRRILERQFTILACRRATSNNLSFLHQILFKIKELLEIEDGAEKAEGKTEEMVEQFIVFHSALADASQNSLLVRIFDRFKDSIFFAPEVDLSHTQLQSLYQLACEVTRSIETGTEEDAVRNMERYLDEAEAVYSKAEKMYDNV